MAGMPAQQAGLVVGTRKSLPDVGESWPFGLDRPQFDGYLIHTIAEGDRALIVIAAPRPKGVLNGAYGLLEQWGFGFYLGGDTIPETIPAIADAAKQDLDVARSPVFAVRGSLPWYNFFNSPTAWELADHKAFIDQLAKMRCNFLGFHAYDHEPFTAYEYEGQLVGGQPLPNTSRANWGTHSMKTDEFFAGTGQYFAREYFGAASSFIEDREEAVAAAKDVLRQALEYAKGRGLQTCLGFEIHGDPLNPDTQARFEARLKALLRDYPMLDCVWLWEPEGMGIGSQGEPRPQSLWQGYTQRWADDFADVPHSYRRSEAVRLTLFALHAHHGDLDTSIDANARISTPAWTRSCPRTWCSRRSTTSAWARRSAGHTGRCPRSASVGPSSGSSSTATSGSRNRICGPRPGRAATPSPKAARGSWVSTGGPAPWKTPRPTAPASRGTPP